jgi:alpha-tubulin suppressor-like RCC1 family protein
MMHAARSPFFRIATLTVLVLVAVSAAAHTQTLAAGASHTAVVSQGDIWTWGANANGQLADGTLTTRPLAAALPTWSGGVVAVAAGSDHTLFLTADGSVYGAGYDSQGQLGPADGQLGDGTFNLRRSPVEIGDLPAISAVTAGSSHTVALGVDGSLYSWDHSVYTSSSYTHRLSERCFSTVARDPCARSRPGAPGARPCRP